MQVNFSLNISLITFITADLWITLINYVMRIISSKRSALKSQLWCLKMLFFDDGDHGYELVIYSEILVCFKEHEETE